MAFEPDRLIDRRLLKRKLNIWRTLAIVIAVALVAALFGRFAGYRSGAYVARLNVENVILDDNRRHQILARIRGDDDAKALIVSINSPGGTVVGGEALYRSLRRVASKKPVVAVMGEMATSAGYMVALGADHIIAREGTLTGSIGVILQTTEISGLLGKLGITTEAIRSSPLKAVPSPFEPLTPEGRAVTRELIADVFAMFRDMVAERRGLTPAQVAALADGRVFTGRMAVGNGLVDALGGEHQARLWLASEKGVATALPVRDIHTRRRFDDLFERLTEIVQKTTLSERLTLDGLISLWHPYVR